MVSPSSVTAQTAVILSEVAQQPTLTIDILATTCYAYPLCFFSTVDVCSTSVGAGEAVIPILIPDNISAVGSMQPHRVYVRAAWKKVTV